MAHGLDEVETAAEAVSPVDAAGPAARVLAYINYVVVILASIALVCAAFVLTYSVVTRYFLKLSTDWQDETSVFLIVGAVFMSAAAVQARRGHVGIEAIVGLLSPRVNRIRQILVDIASLLFCGYFAWKSWTLLHEAWVENYHSGSTWAPPLMDSLFAHDGRHDAAERCNCCCRSSRRCGARDPGHEHIVDRAALRRRHARRDVRRHADCICARCGRDPVHDRVHAGRLGRYHHAERLRGNGLDHAAVDPAVHPEGRGDRQVARRARTSTARCMPGCTGFRAASASPTCSPARCSPPWPAPRPRPARRSARPASRKCASAAIRAASRPASSRPAERSASCCRPRSP